MASHLLHHSWAAISDLYSSGGDGGLGNEPTMTETPLSSSPLVRYKAYQLSKFTIVAFVCEKVRELSPTLQPNHPLFESLWTKENPSISLNQEAITLFHSLLDELSHIHHQTPYVFPATSRTPVVLLCRHHMRTPCPVLSPPSVSSPPTRKPKLSTPPFHSELPMPEPSNPTSPSPLIPPLLPSIKINAVIKKICTSTDSPYICLSSIAPYLSGKVDPVSVLEMEIRACNHSAQIALAVATRISKDPSTPPRMASLRSKMKRRRNHKQDF